MEWKDGKLTSAEISSDKGGDFKVRNAEKTASLTLKSGGMIHLNAELATVN
jgi:hypothetical protein